jgi:hypothetical protein
LKEKRLSDSDSDSVFIGWQEMPSGDVFALYNITVVYHPAYLSTVSEETLKKLRLRIPQQHYSKDRKKSSDITGWETKTNE